MVKINFTDVFLDICRFSLICIIPAFLIFICLFVMGIFYVSPIREDLWSIPSFFQTPTSVDVVGCICMNFHLAQIQGASRKVGNPNLYTLFVFGLQINHQ